MDRQGIKLDLQFAPNAALIGSVRRFVIAFFERALADEATSNRLGLVAHEMLENAVKYSTDPNAPVSILILRPSPESQICLQTRNTATKPNILRLQQLMQSMGTSHDAMLFYQSLMRDSAKRTEGSGLGLARIWAEADMRLSVAVENENEVVLSAITLSAGAPLYPVTTMERP